MLAGSIAMSLMNVSAKFLKQYTLVSVLELCYFRAFVMAVGCYGHAKYSRINLLDIPEEKSHYILLRSIFGMFSFSFQFVGIYMLPLSIAVVLYFTQPISASVVNFIFNKETLSKLEIMSIFSAMLGVIILTSP